MFRPHLNHVRIRTKRSCSPTRTASAASDHPIGVERITDIQLIRPKEYQPIAALTYLDKAGIFKNAEGKEWAIRNHVRWWTQSADERSASRSSADHSLLRDPSSATNEIR